MSIPLTPKEHVSALIGYLKPEHLAALIPLLETMVNPTERHLAAIPWDDEPVSDEEKRDVVASYADIAEGRMVSNAEVLAEYGLTEADFEQMGRTPLVDSALEKV